MDNIELRLPEGSYASFNTSEYPAPNNCVTYPLTPAKDIQAIVSRFMSEHKHKPRKVWFDENYVYIPLESK